MKTDPEQQRVFLPGMLLIGAIVLLSIPQILRWLM